MIVHSTGIPIESRLEAFEFELPLESVHESCEECWVEWTTSLVGMSSCEIQTAISGRLNDSLPEFEKLATKIRGYEPFAVLFFGGKPYVWSSRDNRGYPDSIYIPPPAGVEHLAERLTDFTNFAQNQIRNFIRIYGGIGQRYPWESVEFDRSGTQLRDGSVRVLSGDDSNEWSISNSGVVKHFDHGTECKEKEFSSFEAFIDDFTSLSDIDLFEFVYK